MFYFDDILGKKVLKSDMMPFLNHFFTTREMVLKTKEKDLFNESITTREEIKKNFNLAKLLSPMQTHTSNVALADINIEEYQDTDALILKDKGLGIFLNFADCTPIILYDEKNNLASVVHSGWRGTVAKIVQKACFKMQNDFGSDMADIVALIGPCICLNCFETSFEIMNFLLDTISDKEGCSINKGESFYADLKEINKRQLLEIGVRKIDVAPFCTCCDNDKFFSYRKENKTTNRMSACVFL